MVCQAKAAALGSQFSGYYVIDSGRFSQALAYQATTADEEEKEQNRSISLQV
tara:strand:+ start:53 stop:208 length:156 start_codon:yes stop_codon:yes gene_type:complete